MPLWFQVMTGVFSIISVLFAIISPVVIFIYKKRKNKITTKNIVITYNAEAPQVLKNYSQPVVIAKIGFGNKTSRIINITQMELIDGKRIIQMKDPKKTVNLYISPNGYFTADAAFVVPAPPKYVMSPTCTLRLKANDIILEYEVSTNSSVAPY